MPCRKRLVEVAYFPQLVGGCSFARTRFLKFAECFGWSYRRFFKAGENCLRGQACRSSLPGEFPLASANREKLPESPMIRTPSTAVGAGIAYQPAVGQRLRGRKRTSLPPSRKTLHKRMCLPLLKKRRADRTLAPHIRGATTNPMDTRLLERARKSSRPPYMSR